MSEWFDNKKQSNSNIHKLLQKRIEKANPRRTLTTEETKRLAKLETIAEKLNHGQNVQVHNHRYQINKTAETNAENTPKVHSLQLFVCMVDTVTDWHSETLCKYFSLNSMLYSKRQKNVLFIPLVNL